MNKLLWQSSFALATAAFLAACGDETTNVTETTGPTSVAKFKDLDECTTENDGALVYVKDSAAAYLCSDSVWNVLNITATNGSDGKNGADGKDGKNGTDGKNGANGTDGKDGEDGSDGKDGTSCTATETKDKSGFELTCGGKVIGTITNGTNGTAGLKGEDGKSCEGKANEDGSVTITCDGKKIATIKNGEDGKSAYELSGSKLTLEQWLESLNGDDGEGCTAKTVEGGVEITCGDSEPVKVKNGTNGKDVSVNACKITGDEDGVVTLECAEGEKVTTKTLYKATCGNKPYEPETHFCYFYENEKTFSVLEKCGGEKFNPLVYQCIDNELQNKTICGGKKFDPESEFCAMKGTTVMGVYKMTTITIDEADYSETWMAENLNYVIAEGSSCNPNVAGFCATYGRLYTWDAAKDACPDGWKLPSEYEWNTLLEAVSTSKEKEEDNNPSLYLRADSELWGNGEGNDAFGFAMLPAGGYIEDKGKYVYVGVSESAFFWTISDKEDDALIIGSGADGEIKNGYVTKSYQFSVRCIKDAPAANP